MTKLLINPLLFSKSTEQKIYQEKYSKKCIKELYPPINKKKHLLPNIIPELEYWHFGFDYL